MKIITAMIQPFMLNKVTSALKALESFPRMTVIDARGFVRRRSLPEQHSLHIAEYKRKTRIERRVGAIKLKLAGEDEIGKI